LKLSAALSPYRRVADSSNYKWWVYGAIAVGLFLTVMDQTGVNIALPLIADHFDIDIPTVQWITLGYTLCTSVMLMPMGRLADMIGRKRVLVGGLLIFISAAAFGGSAQVYYVLITAKIVQGVGAAAIQANSMAMITEAFPERERGKALGMYSTIIGTGAMSGPVVGGLLVSNLGWRSVFFAALPVGLIAISISLAVLKDEPTAGRVGRSKLRFDWLGAGLSSGALITFLLSITNGFRLGWDSPPIVAGFASAIALVATFLWWERRATDPMLDLSLFRGKVFSMSVSARALSFLAGSSVFFLMPFYLMQVLGYSASRAGLLMVAGAVGMATMGPLSGRISDRVGTRWPTVVGMALSASAVLLMSRLTVDSSWIHVAVAMGMSGSGMGIFSSPNTSAVMGSIPRDRYGIASAFLNLTRTTSNVTGVAVATTIISVTMVSMGYEPSLGDADSGDAGVRLAFVSGLHRTFLMSFALIFVAMVLSALRGDNRRDADPAEERDD
jgi:EmrB/QacA subfamily drug resistance transporter